MKLLSPVRWLLGTTLASLLAVGCGATDGTATGASAQLIAAPAAGPMAGADHPEGRRGPPDPAQLAQHLDRDHNGRVEVTELPARARERLGAADADHDGVLTVPELAAHLAEMQAQRFARIDTNGDGAVTAAEVGPERWAHLQVADADQDGRVSHADLQAAHASGTLRAPGGGHFGRRAHGPPDPARFVEHFDRNGNGTVELSELPPRLCARLCDADANHDGVLSVDEIRAHRAEHQPGPDAPPAPDSPED